MRRNHRQLTILLSAALLMLSSCSSADTTSYPWVNPDPVSLDVYDYDLSGAEDAEWYSRSFDGIPGPGAQNSRIRIAVTSCRMRPEDSYHAAVSFTAENISSEPVTLSPEALVVNGVPAADGGAFTGDLDIINDDGSCELHPAGRCDFTVESDRFTCSPELPYSVSFTLRTGSDLLTCGFNTEAEGSYRIPGLVDGEMVYDSGDGLEIYALGCTKSGDQAVLCAVNSSDTFYRIRSDMEYSIPAHSRAILFSETGSCSIEIHGDSPSEAFSFNINLEVSPS